jgi:hypothetical protein
MPDLRAGRAYPMRSLRSRGRLSAASAVGIRHQVIYVVLFWTPACAGVTSDELLLVGHSGEGRNPVLDLSENKFLDIRPRCSEGEVLSVSREFF